MGNGIQVYSGDSLNLSTTITTDGSIVLSGFTSIFEVIDTISGNSITVTGSTILSGTTSFTITSTQNSLTPYVYTYEIYIYRASTGEKYTIIQDSYSVLPPN
jgi:hypothetical protein